MMHAYSLAVDGNVNTHFPCKGELISGENYNIDSNVRAAHAGHANIRRSAVLELISPAKNSVVDLAKQ